jgi:hypothetical protein
MAHALPDVCHPPVTREWILRHPVFVLKKVRRRQRYADTIGAAARMWTARGGARMTAFELWVGLALLGLWSCVGVMYRNSRKTSGQMDEIVRLLRVIANERH